MAKGNLEWAIELTLIFTQGLEGEGEEEICVGMED